MQVGILETAAKTALFFPMVFERFQQLENGGPCFSVATVVKYKESSEGDVAAIEHSCQIIRSTRKTAVIQILPDGRILVRCPKRMRKEDICRFLESKQAWIAKHLAKQPAPMVEKLTQREIEKLRAQCRKLITERVKHYAPIVGVAYNQIAIRAQHTRWGSCSSKGNLNFNCLLALTPPEVLDYVVVHELCHRKEMNHSEKFWKAVESVLPDYKTNRLWLKENGSSLLARL